MGRYFPYRCTALERAWRKDLSFGETGRRILRFFKTFLEQILGHKCQDVLVVAVRTLSEGLDRAAGVWPGIAWLDDEPVKTTCVEHVADNGLDAIADAVKGHSVSATEHQYTCDSYKI